MALALMVARDAALVDANGSVATLCEGNAYVEARESLNQVASDQVGRRALATGLTFSDVDRVAVLVVSVVATAGI